MKVSHKDTKNTNIFFLSGLLFVLLAQNLSAQKKEKAKSDAGEYGNTLNIGLGMGYTGGVPLLFPVHRQPRLLLRAYPGP